MAIPPAWTQVWLAADRWSHLQATGRDARGRKRYRYHSALTSNRAENKFADLVAFGTRLGPLRRRVSRDLRRNDLGQDRVVATIVRLMDITSLRVGNISYATTNESFGLTTLRNEHVAVRGTTIQLAFRGKSAHEFDVSVDNARLAKIVRRCQDLPGQQLFEYRSADGEIRRIGSADVNRYLNTHAGAGVTAKTFRTWNATVRAADGLAAASEHVERPTNRVLNDVLESYVQGTLLTSWSRAVGDQPAGLTAVERRTLRLLRRTGLRQLITKVSAESDVG